MKIPFDIVGSRFFAYNISRFQFRKTGPAFALTIFTDLPEHGEVWFLENFENLLKIRSFLCFHVIVVDHNIKK